MVSRLKTFQSPVLSVNSLVFKVGFDWYVQNHGWPRWHPKIGRNSCVPWSKVVIRRINPIMGIVQSLQAVWWIYPLLYAKECEFRLRISDLWGFLIFHLSSKPTFLEAETLHSLMGSAPYKNILEMRKCLPECQYLVTKRITSSKGRATDTGREEHPKVHRVGLHL